MDDLGLLLSFQQNESWLGMLGRQVRFVKCIVMTDRHYGLLYLLLLINYACLDFSFLVISELQNAKK